MLSGYFYIIITKEVRMSFRGRLGYCEDFPINIWHCCFTRQEKDQMSMAHRERIQLNINRQTVCVCVCVWAALFARRINLLDFWPGSVYGSSETLWRVWCLSVLPGCLWLSVRLNNVRWMEEIPQCSFKVPSHNQMYMLVHINPQKCT